MSAPLIAAARGTDGPSAARSVAADAAATATRYGAAPPRSVPALLSWDASVAMMSTRKRDRIATGLTPASRATVVTPARPPHRATASATTNASASSTSHDPTSATTCPASNVAKTTTRPASKFAKIQDHARILMAP